MCSEPSRMAQYAFQATFPVLCVARGIDPEAGVSGKLAFGVAGRVARQARVAAARRRKHESVAAAIAAP